MTEDELRRFAPLYGNARWYGADASLRRYLGLAEDRVVPLALPHGVDFGHVRPVQDLLAVEPIHWAHNREIAVAAAPHKPVLAMPHPFLLELWQQPEALRQGTVVVGPPPGPANDRRLLAALGDLAREDTTILVKPKPGYRQSMAFWRGHGFAAATLADFGAADYRTTATFLRAQQRVIGCTFSSLVVFAAAAGARVELLQGYRYDCYDLVEIGSTYEVVDWSAPRAQAIVRAFATAPYREVVALAQDILGAGLERDPALLRAQLDQAVAALREPVYFHSKHGPATRWLSRELARRSGRPGVLRIDPRRWLRRRFAPSVWARDLDEIGLWLDGRSPATISEAKHRYIRGRTEPGDAVEQYADG